MKLSDKYRVDVLYRDRSNLLGQLACVRRPDTRYFNVHFHGTAAGQEVAEVAAAALVPFFEAKVAAIDEQLRALGVEPDA